MQDGEDYIHVNGAIGSAAQTRVGLEGRQSSVAARGLGRNNHRLAGFQNSRARSSLRIAGAQLGCQCGAGALARVLLALTFALAFQQTFGVLGGEPVPFFGYADGNHFVFLLINCV